MNQQKFSDIYSEELAKDAILNQEYKGFKEDYLTLHCLLKIHKPHHFFEIGTNMGTGTKIIKNALGENSKIYSLDLPTELAHISLQHPINEGKGDNVGSRCNLPFIQLRGDSLQFDYFKYYPIDGWFIDGEHDFKHSNHESKEAIKSKAKIIIWHDSDIENVYNGIMNAFKGIEYSCISYDLFRVADTRIAYALKK